VKAAPPPQPFRDGNMQKLFIAVAVLLLAWTAGADAAAGGKQKCSGLKERIQAKLNGPLPKGYNNFSRVASGYQMHQTSRLEYLAACGGADAYERVRREIYAMERALLADCHGSIAMLGGGKINTSSLDRFFNEELQFVKSRKNRFCAYANSEAGSALIPQPAFDPNESSVGGCVSIVQESDEVYRFHNRCKFDVTFSYTFMKDFVGKGTVIALRAESLSERLQKADDRPYQSLSCKTSDRDCVSSMRSVLGSSDKH
jgi:hypothetical protein